MPALRARLAASGDLDATAAVASPEAYDEALEAAVRRFQGRMGLEADGVVGAGTIAELNVPVADRIRQLRINLDRGRVLLQDLPPEFIVVNVAGEGTTKYPFETDPDYYYPPDCDHAPMPLPAWGAVEQTYDVEPDLSSELSGYSCAGFDDGDDCHLIVFAPLEDRLYEIYHATRRATATEIEQANFNARRAIPSRHNKDRVLFRAETDGVGVWPW